MVDRKIIDLPIASDASGDDLLLVVDDPGGLGTNKKLTIQTLTANLHGRGTIAARPVAEIRNTGNYYFSTDEGILYQSTGTGWSAIARLTLSTNDIPYGIDASKIGTGTVNNPTFAHLAGVTSSIQNQLNNKQSLNSNLTTLSTPGTALQQIRVNSAGTALEYFTPAAADGTVTSVGLSLPSLFTVSGSPITTSGTLTATLASQSARSVFAAPTGASGTPSFRALEAADIQSGTFAIARGGTGQTTAAAAFDALSPLTTLGDILFRNSTGNTRLAGNITTAKQFLSQTGTGSASAAPVWSALSASDIPSGIAATNIGAGTVDNTTFGFLAGVTSAIQTQINNRQPLNANLTTVAAIGTALQQIRVNGTGTALEYFSPDGNATTLNGQNAAFYLNRANHTGTQAWSTIASTPTTLAGYGITDAVSNSALAAWTGSTNITTLGTITAGTWNGSAIAPTHGGTGLTTLGSVGQSIRVNAAGTGFEFYTPSSGGGSLPSLTSAQIWIGDSTNTAVARSLSGAVTVSDTGVVSLGSRVVSNDAIRSGTACSVIGRATGTLGQVADIVASTNYTVLRRAGSANLAFGTLDFNYLTASANTLIGRGDTAGTTQEIPCTAFARTLLDDSDAATARATLAISPNTGSVCDGRLTLTSGVPNTAGTNVIGATSIFFTPYIGNLVSLWSTSESRWVIYPFTELSLSLAGTTANTNYDIFLFDNAGTLTLEYVAWADSNPGTSARATAITRLNGTWVKSTDNRRYMGSFRTTSAGMTEDSETGTPKCFLQNAVNRVKKCLNRGDSASSWTYTGTSFRPSNNNTSNRVEVINGIESTLSATYLQSVDNDLSFRIGLGINSTTTNSANIHPLLWVSQVGAHPTGTAVFQRTISLGYNYLQMLERSVSGSGLIFGSPSGSGMIAEYWA